MLPLHLEKIIFHYVLKNKEYLNVVKDSFFKTPNYDTLFKCAKAFIAKYNTAPTNKQMYEIVKLKNLTETINKEFVDTLYDVQMDQYDNQWLEENITSWIEYKNLDTSVENLVTYLKTTKVDTGNIKDVVEKAKDIIVSGNNLDFGFDEGLDFFNPESHIQPTWDTFSTGFKYLDTVLGGGWATKSLYVLAGLQKVGKCCSADTKIRIRNKTTGEIKEITLEIGDLFDTHASKNKLKRFSQNIFKKLNGKESIDGKFINAFEISNLQVKTDTGWEDIKHIGKTIEYEKWVLKTETFELKCADNHIVFDENFNEKYVSELSIGDLIMTEFGPQKVISIENTHSLENMYDIEVNSNNHRYYTNGILSHNSIWLANLCAKSVQMGYNSALISCEMKDRHCVKRLGANLLGISMKEYADAANDQDLMKKKLNHLNEENGLGLIMPGKLYVKEYPASSASIKDVERWLLKMEELKGIKFKTIFIDYINILQNWRNPNTENTYMKIKQIAEDMRAMATRNNWAVITLTQLNRAAEGTSRIALSNVAESSGLGQTVDWMGGIIQDEFMYANNEYMLQTMLNRNEGYKNSKKKFSINYDYMRLTETDDEIIQGD